MNQVEELNQVISEISEIYSKRVRKIAAGTLIFDSNELKELRHVRKQLNLLFEIRDNCLKVLEDLELLKSYSSKSYLQ
jgi:hypothetical protein